MWKAQQGGRTLHFRLFGINNQNFIMRDDETGSWWQQVSGRAIQGPLAGHQLEPMPWDEVTFDVWKREHPETQVLAPSAADSAHYESADWEAEVARYPVREPAHPDEPLRQRDLVVGLSIGGVARAYPWSVLTAQNPLADSLGGMPLLLVLAPDGRSVRGFDRRVAGLSREFFLRPGSDPPELVDARTGSTWDFAGRATAGPSAGQQLARLQCLKDFWFDWRNYHPGTGVYDAGRQGAGDGK